MNEEDVRIKEEVKKVIISLPSNEFETTRSLSRNSIEVKSKILPLLLSRDEKIVPHYLRASTSSCHDFCKYGKNHIFEAKKRLPIRRSFPLTNAVKNKELKEAGFSNVRDRKKVVVKMKSVSHTENKEMEQNGSKALQKLSGTGAVQEKESIESSSPTEKRIIISHEVVTPIDLFEKFSDGSESMDFESQSPVYTPKNLVDTSYEENAKIESITSAKEPDKSKDKTRMSHEEEKLSKKLIKNSKFVDEKKRELPCSELKKSNRIKEKKIESAGKSSTMNKKTQLLVEKNKIRDLEQKSPSLKKAILSTSPKTTTSRIKPSISPKTPLMNSTATLVSSRRLSTQISTNSKIIRSVDSALKLSRASTSKTRAKDEKTEQTSENVNEKTLYIIEPKQQVKKIRAYTPSNARTYSISSLSSREKENGEKKRLNKTPTRNQDSKIASPHRLNFQRGTVVNPKPENSSPRTLKFRQAKGSNDSPKSRDSEKRTFRVRRTSFGSSKELKASSLKAPKVVLRHQDVKEKKEAQGLFNVVIEETASKLAETRKSKVKALVGAFETVISLQEKRVAALSI